jgi:hypothetical protein
MLAKHLTPAPQILDPAKNDRQTNSNTSNIRLGLKRYPSANTLAYSAPISIAIKFFCRIDKRKMRSQQKIEKVTFPLSFSGQKESGHLTVTSKLLLGNF